MKVTSHFTLITLFFLSFCTAVQAQSKDKNAVLDSRIQEWLNKKNFVFKANTMLPTGFRSRQLEPGYQISVRPEKLVSALPFVGRSNNVIPGSTDGGMNFTSVDFTFDIREGKKGGWTVTVKPKDVIDVRTVTFLISSGGNTTVTITSNSRSSISYNGILEAGK